MRNKRLCAICLLLACACLLGGCQLAREDADTSQAINTDLLVGVLITRDEVDWPQAYGEAENPEEKAELVGQMVFTNQVDVFQDRVYAALVTPDENSDYQEYRFEDVEGIQYFVSRIVRGNGEVYDTQTLYPENSLVPDGRHIIVTDEEDRSEVSATLYLLPEMFASAWNVNPVYQTPEGEVYAERGGAGIMSSGLEEEGARFSQTLEGRISMTENGETKIQSTRTEIAFEMMYEPKTIAVLHFDAQGTLLERQEYVPGEMPNELGAHHDAAYLIVETHKLSPKGETVVARQLLQPGDETVQTCYAREDGICAAAYTTLYWAG